MNPILPLLILPQILLSSASVFFHELSHVVLKPGGTGGHATFGFSLGYLTGMSPNLVTGAPKSSSIGKVYRCPFSEVLTNKKIDCQDLSIDVDKLAPRPENATDISLNLGYSISAAKDYFFTCAPRWSATTERYNTSLFGTCFVYNDTSHVTHRYDGIFEQYINLKYKEEVLDRIIGGNGWRTLMDTENDLLIIAKIALRADFTYVAASSPLEPVRSMTTGAKVDSSQTKNANRFGGYRKIRNMGFSLAAGKFFNSRTMYYALSATGPIGAGVVNFLYSSMSPSQKVRKLKILLKGGTPVSIADSTVGSMFGAAMSSADVDRDSLAELLVGAPAQGNDEGGNEAGAVHIYLGGDEQNINAHTRHRVLLGAKPNSRFGNSIAASDIDGDELPEIFIGAPFEDLGNGALYIVSGFEINKNLMESRGFKEISVSQLKLTQIIRNRDFKTFGYSLQVVPDIDGNGCDELAVGSPGSANIMFLRCMPAINVIIDADAGDQVVREQDKSFSVLVCVNVFNKKKTQFSAEFTVTNEVIGNGAYIEDHLMTYKFGLHGNMAADNCTSVVVKLRDNEPGAYILYSKVVMDEESILNSTDFNSSWAMLSPESEMETSVKVSRHCLGKDCEPDLSMNITWTGGNNSTYELGSSETLTAKLRVRNVGNSSRDACALVRLAGAPVAKFGCVSQGDGSYKCPMPTPLRRNAEYEIDIKFNMSQPTNLDKELKVNVVLRDICYKPNVTEEKNLTISLQLRTDDVLLEGYAYNQNVSDAEIRDQKTPYVNDAHRYSIINAGSVTWKNIQAVISIDKKPYIDENSYRVSSVVSRCDREELTHRYIFNCTLDLLPRTTVKIFASTSIIKNQIIDNLVEGSLNVNSAFILYLEPTSEGKKMRLSTIISLRKELSLGQNKNLIIFLAILGAIVALAVLIFILYKMKFFKREEKTKLQTLKQNHIRRQSVKRSTSMSQDREQIIDENMDLEVDDDDPFETVDITEPVLKHHQNTPNETESPR